MRTIMRCIGTYPLSPSAANKDFAEMSKYLEAIAESLIDELNGAAGCSDHRIVGYAANVDFWVAEIGHCIAALDGFPQRQALFADAVIQAAKGIREAEIQTAQRLGASSDPTQLLYGEASNSSQPERYLENIATLRIRLIEAARKFLGRMRSEDLISLEKWRAVKEQLPFV
jgi:hypothetical protein